MPKAKETTEATTTEDPFPATEAAAEAVEEQAPEVAAAEAAGDPEPAPQEEKVVPIDLPKVRKLGEPDFQSTELVQNMFTAFPPIGTTPEDVTKPIFWTHVARQMSAMMEIRIMPKCGSWYGIYLCLYADDHQATVKELMLFPLDVEDKQEDAAYYVKWVSPPLKWGVIRRADNERVKDGFPTRKAATIWMTGHAKQNG